MHNIEKSSMSEQKFSALADEVICIFLPHLSVQMLVTLTRVNKQCYRLSNDEKIWQNLLSRYFPSRLKSVSAMTAKEIFIENYKKHFSGLKGDDRKFFMAVLRAEELQVKGLLNKTELDAEMQEFFRHRYLAIEDGAGRTALEWAIILGHEQIAAILINALTETNCEMFLLAIEYGRIEIFQLLIHKAAIRDTSSYQDYFYDDTKNHMTWPTVVAAKHGRVEMFCLTFPYAENAEKNIAVHHAIAFGHVSLIQLLPKLGYYLRGYPAESFIYELNLWKAYMQGEKLKNQSMLDQALLVMLKILLKQGANINAEPGNFYNGNPKYYSILQLSIRYNRSKIALFLIENGININYQARDGRTALHFAVQYFNAEIVRILCSKEVDLMLKISSGQTALDLCNELIEANKGPLAKLHEIKKCLEIPQQNLARGKAFLAAFMPEHFPESEQRVIPKPG
jgi:hypothetical protein